MPWNRAVDSYLHHDTPHTAALAPWSGPRIELLLIILSTKAVLIGVGARGRSPHSRRTRQSPLGPDKWRRQLGGGLEPAGRKKEKTKELNILMQRRRECHSRFQTKLAAPSEFLWF